CKNEMRRGLAQRPMIVGVSYDLRGDSWGCVPRSLFWWEDLDRDGECGFDCLTYALVSSKAHREGCRASRVDPIRASKERPSIWRGVYVINEDAKTESDEDDIYKYKIRVRKDEDEEMLNAKVEDSDKGDEEVIDAAKTYVEKNSEAKDDAKKTELPPSSSSLSESPSTAIATTLPPPSVSTTPSVPQQTTTPIPNLPTTIDA
ncbi:hypothetical protein Tco_1488072, partial [Tanacetum coccineum]